LKSDTAAAQFVTWVILHVPSNAQLNGTLQRKLSLMIKMVQQQN